MVYRSFGKEIPQAAIWPAIAKENRIGSIASTTHLMVRDAIARGFAAVAIQARHPLQVLRLSRDSGIRAILNHRLAQDSREGHYTVLVDLDDRDVILHDPYRGPLRRVPHADLLDVWQPRVPDSEIFGNLLIGIAAEPGEPASCWLCRATTPSSVPCPKCRNPVGLQPNALFGCTSSSCAARVWNAVCCPACDCVFTFGIDQAGATDTRILYAPAQPEIASEPAEETRPALPAEEDPFQLAPVFAEIDKFLAQVSSLPGLENHEGIKQQLALMAARKQDLKLAQTEAAANRVLNSERWSNVERLVKQNQAAHSKKMEELNQPAPALDGNALGKALMKNLGFIR